MAVASDLPALENRREYKDARNSILYDVHGKQLGVLHEQPEPPARARRRHLAATCATRSSRSRTSASTRTRASTCAASGARSSRTSSTAARRAGRLDDHPAVREERACSAQSKRTVFEKLREAALAYHLTRKWSKEKILTEYLNSIYFGNGAYGIESAARTYFGNEPDHQGCGGHRAPVRQGAQAPRGRAARRHRRQPQRLRPGRPPRGRRRAGATSCSPRCSTQERISRLEYVNARREALPGQRAAAVGRDRRRRTSRPGCASSSSTATGRGARSRAA